MSFEQIKSNAELIDLLASLPPKQRIKLIEFDKNKVLKKEHTTVFSLERAFNSWKVIIRGKERPVNISKLINTLNNCIKEMEWLKEKLEILKEDMEEETKK